MSKVSILHSLLKTENSHGHFTFCTLSEALLSLCAQGAFWMGGEASCLIQNNSNTKVNFMPTACNIHLTVCTRRSWYSHLLYLTWNKPQLCWVYWMCKPLIHLSLLKRTKNSYTPCCAAGHVNYIYELILLQFSSVLQNKLGCSR